MNKEALFQALNYELEQANLHLEVICVGGYVLEYYSLRGTQDVDAFYQESAAIRNIIKKVGDVYGVNIPGELWLNNSVSNLNKIPPKEICTPVFNFSNLKIYIPPLLYILGMKLESGRNRDKQDIADIIKISKIKSPKQLEIKLKKYHFQTDMSMILEGFEIAYGIEWLGEYMRDHIDEFREY